MGLLGDILGEAYNSFIGFAEDVTRDEYMQMSRKELEKEWRNTFSHLGYSNGPYSYHSKLRILDEVYHQKTGRPTWMSKYEQYKKTHRH